MRKGFTLLELVVVIIIIGVLATLGIQQYAKMVERSRGAEARSILGQVRSSASSLRLERGSLQAIGPWAATNQIDVGIDNPAANPDAIPSVCSPTHFFSYAYVPAGVNNFVATATRCIAGGKTPNAAAALTLILTTNLAAGTDTWTGTGGY